MLAMELGLSKNSNGAFWERYAFPTLDIQGNKIFFWVVGNVVKSENQTG